MKHYYTFSFAVLLALVLGVTSVHAQTAPTLYNQTGGEVNAFDSTTNSLTPGWYYDASGNPNYYYANGVYYNPSTQSYGGSILYPNAEGPQTLSAELLTPGVPNTGIGGNPLTIIGAIFLSALAGLFGTAYLSRNDLIS